MDDAVLPVAEPQDGVGLCLSGGSYRAMLFHVGALWRLMDCGKLFELTRVPSVSGGSITAALLALAWNGLHWGYAVADAGIRRYWKTDVAAPAGFPYPAPGIG